MQERMAQNEISLDQPAGPDDATPLIDAIADNEWNPEERASRAQWRDFAREQVEDFAATLKDKELAIFRARLMAEDPVTLQDVGDRLGVSPERQRQVETRLKNRLREFLHDRAADIDHAET